MIWSRINNILIGLVSAISSILLIALGVKNRQLKNEKELRILAEKEVRKAHQETKISEAQAQVTNTAAQVQVTAAETKTNAIMHGEEVLEAVHSSGDDEQDDIYNDIVHGFNGV